MIQATSHWGCARALGLMPVNFIQHSIGLMLYQCISDARTISIIVCDRFYSLCADFEMYLKPMQYVELPEQLVSRSL